MAAFYNANASIQLIRASFPISIYLIQRNSVPTLFGAVDCFCPFRNQLRPEIAEEVPIHGVAKGHRPGCGFAFNQKAAFGPSLGRLAQTVPELSASRL